MKKMLAALAAFFLVLIFCVFPAAAMDRTQHLTGLNPPSTWMNQEQRDVRLGVGAFWWNLFCGSNTTCGPFYGNLSVVPVTGLFVAVGPTNANTVGTVYQFLAEETTGYGGFPSGVGTFLATDATKVVLQGTSVANSANIGPLNPPGTGGQSINYLIEGQVQTADITSQTVNIVSSGGSVTATSANRDRVDRIIYQSKAGTAATTGTQTTPAVDAGWVAIGFVAVANGTVTITSGMISALPGSSFNGAALLANAGATPIDTSGSAQTKTGPLSLATANTAVTPLVLSVPTAGSSILLAQNNGSTVAQISNTGQMQASVQGGTGSGGLLLPTYGAAGTAIAATGHLVISQFAGTGGTVTIALTNSSATFTNGATWGGIAMDVTAPGFIAATNASATSVQFVGTNVTHTYMALIYGY